MDFKQFKEVFNANYEAMVASGADLFEVEIDRDDIVDIYR